MDARTQIKDLARDVAELSGQREQLKIILVYQDLLHPARPPEVAQVFTCPAPPNWRPE